MGFRSTLRRAPLGLAASLILVAMAATVSGPAFAGTYDGTAAANYADKYATNGNSAYWTYTTDCTNFVSQALRAGGWTFSSFGANLTSPSAWYYDNNGTTWITWDDVNSNTWSVAKMLYSLTVLDSSPVRGKVIATYPGTTSTAYPSGVSKGDLMFYDWDGDAVVNHVSIVAGSGTDPNGGDIGTLVDQHTKNRFHAIWSLETYNTDKYTTTIYVTHLNTNI